MLTSYRQLSSLRNTPGQAPGRGALESPWPRSLTWMSGARCVGLLMVATLVATIVGRKRVGSGRAVFAHRVGGGGAVGIGRGGVRGSLIGGGGLLIGGGGGAIRVLDGGAIGVSSLIGGVGAQQEVGKEGGFQEGNLAEEKPVNEGATGDGGDGHGSKIEEGVSLGFRRRGRGADGHGSKASHGQDCNLHSRKLLFDSPGMLYEQSAPLTPLLTAN